jgi:aryl-alcohol dehydrogenase
MTGSGAVLGQFKAEPGSTIAVFGLGGVGISALMAAKICNCTTIIAVDIVESRLELAKELGATHTINGKQIEDVVGEIKKITGGKGVDYAVEATGFEPVVRNAIHSMGMGSEIAIIGPATHFEFEQLWGELYGKTIRVINMGMVQPKLFIPKLVEWYKKGMFPIDKICKTYTLDDINVAFEDSLNGTSIKPIIKFE